MSLNISSFNVIDVYLNIFIAGTDTSAFVITWAMTALIKAPTAMKKAHVEVRNLVGNRGAVNDDDIQNLPYLKALIKETMRLFPPAPLLVPRDTIEKCTLNGFEIQSETTVFVNVWAIGRDPEYWENASEFLPEIFLDSGIDYRGQDFGLILFGSGRRGCPDVLPGIAMHKKNALRLVAKSYI
ncbi:cytochrome P450 71A1-like [Henckelia pumila]|uniref:cytochrome P450 71A1-like n=1 Tax=Henckelia pumila TaxID=405737 RepID=UPI003C6DB9A1